MKRTFLAACMLLMLQPAFAQITESQTMLEQAKAKLADGKLDETESLCIKLLGEFPSSREAPKALYLLGEIPLERDQIQEARAVWQTVVEKYPDSPEAPKAKLGIVNLDYRSGANRENRMLQYQDIVAKYPDSPEAEESRFRIGALHKARPPDFDKALAAFDYLIENAADPKWRAEAYVEKGMTYLQRYWNQGRRNLQDRDDALMVFITARQQYPDQADAVARGELREAVYYLYSEQNPAKARARLMETIQAFPETLSTTDVLYQIAYCSFAEKEYDKCIQLVEKIIEERPPSEWNWYLQFFLGTCHLKAGRKAEAKAAFEKTINLYPDTRWAKNAEGVLRNIKF